MAKFEMKSDYPDAFINDKPVGEAVYEACMKYASDIALIDGMSGKSTTYSTLAQKYRTIATHLHYDYKIEKGDKCIIALPNSLAHISIMLALIDRGAVVTGLVTFLTHHELEHYLHNGDTKYVFTNDETYKTYITANNNLKEKSMLQKIFVLNPSNSQLPSLCANMNTLYQPTKKPIPPVSIYTHTDLLLLPYSSGTTGLPKGVMVSHYGLMANMAQFMNPAFYLVAAHREPSFLIVPISHVYGTLILFSYLFSGAAIITIPQFDKVTFLTIIRMLYLAPPIALFLSKDELVSKYDLTSVQCIYCSAAPLGKDTCTLLLSRFPNLKYILQSIVYGMSEHGVSHQCPPIPARSPDAKLGSVGLLVANYQCMIINPDNGQLLGTNEHGEICVRASNLMLGYLKNEEATQRTIDQHGWLHTDGFYYIVDRLKELIKVNGYQVSPAELEDVLLSHPLISDAAVIGVSHERCGQVPVAFVVKSSKELTEHDIMEYVNTRVARYKQLGGGVRFVNAIPRLPNGKILRREIRAMLERESNGFSAKL